MSRRRRRRIPMHQRLMLRRAVRKRIMTRPVTIRDVKNLIKNAGESKYHDVNVNGSTTPILSTGQVVHLTHIGQGDTVYLRDSNRISVQSLQMKLHLRGDDTAPHDTVARIIIFTTKDCDGRLPLIGNELLEADLVYRLRDVQHMPDFNVLLDKTLVLPQRNSPDENIVPIKVFEWYKKWETPLKVWYNGTAGDITESTCNHLFMACIVNQATGDQPLWYYSIRIRFKDQ